jgi:predicted ATPase with chaperone activity
MSEMCACGNPEGTNEECERCALLRMGGVLARLSMRLADRLDELGEEVFLTAEEAGALFRRTAEETETVLNEAGVEPVSR